MASSKKKRAVEDSMKAAGEELPDDGSATSEDDCTDESENEFMDQEVQVEFEARMPEDSDFNGIKTLLQQLFLKTSINLSEMTDLIISQNYVGSVIKEKECVKQLVSLVTTQCQEAAPELSGNLTEILHHDTVGLLLNERFINIPPQITVPAFQSLRSDMEKACRKNMPFTFSFFLMLCKTYRYKAKPKPGQPELFFSNPEEELISDMSDLSATWSVATERDGVSDGRWDMDDMEATRTLLLFQADKFGAIIDKLKAELAKT
ncbi:hypothetical protein BaRGS_00007931 [Batillaria attramentaria]|uniref:Protein BCCIP homolog n=1 Tax=Batillaria attramentaria TaxID=370345 RepID=A0ABD0LM62_9CAEN